MKIKVSITKKLFIITTLVFAVFIGSTLMVQSLFFEKFYMAKKTRDTKASMESLRAAYINTGAGINLEDFIDENTTNTNMRVVIIDTTGKIKYMPRPVRGRFTPPDPRDMIDFIRKWVENPDYRRFLSFQNHTAVAALKLGAGQERILLGVSQIPEKNEVIFGFASLQPVNEATAVIKQLYLYFSIGACIIIILLSFIYSRLIAKPLVKINKTATKMAELDFSEKCNVTSQDELGSVAASLNFLSENLDRALTSLQAANAKLEEDIEKERTLERMRKDFIASVSHELKTPISLIDGYTAGLKDNIFEGEEKDFYLDIIADEAKKMGHLVSDMTDLSQLESGCFNLIREEFSLATLIALTLKKYEAIIAEKPAHLEISLIEHVKVNADWHRLEQVLTNFVTNALRHVNESGTITVRMTEESGTVAVEIENTGSHIPEEELTKIWDKFYKIDKSGNRKFGGTGIGLSIVKNILMLHHYSFGVCNTASGVKFYFIIPQ